MKASLRETTHDLKAYPSTNHRMAYSTYHPPHTIIHPNYNYNYPMSVLKSQLPTSNRQRSAVVYGNMDQNYQPIRSTQNSSMNSSNARCHIPPHGRFMPPLILPNGGGSMPVVGYPNMLNLPMYPVRTSYMYGNDNSYRTMPLSRGYPMWSDTSLPHPMSDPVPPATTSRGGMQQKPGNSYSIISQHTTLGKRMANENSIKENFFEVTAKTKNKHSLETETPPINVVNVLLSLNHPQQQHQASESSLTMSSSTDSSNSSISNSSSDQQYSNSSSVCKSYTTSNLSPKAKKRKPNQDALKKYACTFPGCNYRSTRSGNLKVHLRSHSGERPYRCEVEGCSYASTQLSNLKIHSRTHTGIRPYPCDVGGCTFASAQRSNLKAHKRRVHGVT